MADPDFIISMIKAKSEYTIKMFNHNPDDIKKLIPNASPERALGKAYTDAMASGGSVDMNEHFALTALTMKRLVLESPGYTQELRDMVITRDQTEIKQGVYAHFGKDSAFDKLSEEDKNFYCAFIDSQGFPDTIYLELLTMDVEAHENKLKMQAEAETKTEAPAAKEEAGTPQAFFYDYKTEQIFNTGATGTAKETTAYIPVHHDTHTALDA